MSVSFLACLSLLGVGAVGALAVQSWFGSTDDPPARRVFQEMHPTIVDNTNGKALSAVLDEIIEPPAVIGYVRGVVVDEGHTVELGNQLFTDHPFRITGFFGPDNPGYTNGALITVRTPGGSKGNVTAVASDSPRVEPGMTLYVIAAEEGAFGYGGGDTLTRLVAVVPGQDVFEVRGGRVFGQAPRVEFSESEQEFQAHFRRP